MSLINDLVIEIDRRNARKRRVEDSPLDGLSPGPRPRHDRRGLWSIAVLIGTVIGFGFLTGSATHLWTLPAGSRDSTSFIGSLARRTDIPPVGAAPSARDPIVRPSRDAHSSPLSGIDREEVGHSRATISSIDLLRSRSTTRLQIVASQPTSYRIEPRSNEREIEVILESVDPGSSMPELDLADTPIRSIQLHANARDLRLSLRLDEPVRIQSHWIDENGRSILVVDLQRPSPSDRPEIVEDDEGSRIGPGETGALDIARSADDRRRKNREALNTRARRSLEAARRARSRSDSEEADRLYRLALEDRPDYREAILERAALLAAMGRRPEALGFIRQARRADPTESGFAMLEARLVAGTGDLDAAIRILDEAGFDPTLAPEVHALASAYLQRAGLHERAIERYEAVLRRHPNESRWWMGLGISLEAMNQKVEALNAYRVAVRIGGLPGGTRHWVSARIADLREGD